MSRILLHRHARPGGRGIRSALQQLKRRPVETHKGRRIQRVREVRANRTHRRLITQAEAHVLHRVVEVLQILLMKPQRKIVEAAIHVADIVKQHPLNIRADQRKAQLDIIREQRVAPQREAGGRDAGPPGVTGAPVSRGPASL